MSKNLRDKIINMSQKKTLSHFATLKEFRTYSCGYGDAVITAAELVQEYGELWGNPHKDAISGADGALPELPQQMRLSFERPHGVQQLFYFTADQMRDYARAAIAACGPNAALVEALKYARNWLAGQDGNAMLIQMRNPEALAAFKKIDDALAAAGVKEQA